MRDAPGEGCFAGALLADNLQAIAWSKKTVA
jgi:hypothetical protein